MALYQQTGTDSSGRPILMSDHMRGFWDTLCDRLGFVPTIVQGAWMKYGGGGASASAGYHDLGGPLDLRTWDLTDDQVKQVIREWRRLGGPIWVRDQRHGMDPHMHGVVPGDLPMDDGCAWQIDEWLAGRDGLSSQGPDYHWRPNPIRLYEGDDMPTAKDVVDELMNRNLTAKDGELTVARALRQAANADDVLRAINDLPDAIEVELPTSASLTRADVRKACAAAVRRVLGQLDEES